MGNKDKVPIVGVIMGSKSDWEQMEPATKMLEILGIAYEVEIVSAHRTPRRMVEYATTAYARGLRIIIAAAGGSAHLQGMTASFTELPVLAVAIKSATFGAEPAIQSCIYMPGGAPLLFAGVAQHGAKNAALGAAQILALQDPTIRTALIDFRMSQEQEVLENPDPRVVITK